MALEPALAGVLTLIGVALTSIGVFSHTGQAIAPGALSITLGGMWLGNSLARHDVRLLPGTQVGSHVASQSDSDGTA